ncbi:MAG: hypothetical protein HYS23_12815 [Geobacter sp.]|nr:hypothetical protein [Geobacter sp.]
MKAIDYELLSSKKAEVLQKSTAHSVRHGSEGLCPTCGQSGIYDLKGLGLMASSIFYSTELEQWRCPLCDLGATGY